MAQLVLGVAGAAIGAFVGGPTGAQIGWALGSAIGGAFQPAKKVQGPTQPLIDLRVMGASYGQNIPYAIGTVLVAGQMWWNTDRRPTTTTTTTSSGGKGGSPEVETTTSTTTYDMDALIGLCDNQITGIRRIWWNGELVYSANADSDVASLTASQATSLWDRMTVYVGSDTQLPDATYEAAVGTTDAVAYRGRAYVFFQGLKLGQSGQVPNLTFEVVVDGSVTTISRTWASRTTTAKSWVSVAYGGGKFVAVANNGPAMYSTDGITWSLGSGSSTWPWRAVAYSDTLGLFVAIADNGPQMYSSDGITWSVNASLHWFINNNWRGLVYAEGKFVATGGNSGPLADGAAVSTDGIGWSYIGVPANNNWTVTYGNGTFVGVGNTGTGRAMYSPDGTSWTQVTPPEDNEWQSVCYGNGLFVAVASSGTNRVMTSTDGTSWTARSAPLQAWRSVAYGGGLFVAVASSGIAAEQVMTSPDGITWTQEASAVAHQWQGVAFGGLQFVAVSNSVTTSDAMNRGVIDATLVSSVPPTVSDAVSRLCLRAGLASGQFDVTSLSSISRKAKSLALSQLAPTRAALELLMSVYFFELVVSDKIYFRPRGGASALTIPYLDLGATLSADTGDDEDALPLKEANELEIPALIAVTYLNIDNDYEEDTQYSDRLISAAAGATGVMQLAIGLTPSEAKAVADTMLLDQSVARLSAPFALLGSYCALEPTDVVTVTAADGSTFRMRLVKKTDSYPLLQFEAVLDDASVLSSQGITSADYTPTTTVLGAAVTSMELMDIPILLDADNDSGFYVAAKGDRSPYPGSIISISTDGGVEYSRVATVTDSAVFGTCSTTLGDWTGPRVVDELNSVTVDVGDGVLSSSSRAAVLNSLAVNAMLVGSELIQFISAELISTGVYKLTGLVRGGRGTEWAMTGHAADERCVLLQASGLRRVRLSNSQLGQSFKYKGVTAGQALTTVSAVDFTDSAIGLKPFSPIDARGSRDGSNNLTITWQRRSRLTTRMLGTLGINVPLGEASESYQVDVYVGSPLAVVRTISAASESASYSAADQTADGHTPGDPIYMKIYQLSSTVGRGYPLEATV